MATTLRNKTRVSGAAGAPATLATGELAYNNVDGKWYCGFGDNGSGVATSVKCIAQDNFVMNLPAGVNGKILGFSGGLPVWQDAPEGSLYSASGDGIELTGSTFSLNFPEIATGIGLSAKLDISAANQPNGYVGLNASGVISDINAVIPAGELSISQVYGLQSALDSTEPPIVGATANEFYRGDKTFVQLDAADIKTGVFDIARIPVLPGNQTVVASGDLSTLNVTQQNSIAEGTIVTTSDGRRWVYNAGSKTLEASYVQLADITPEWSVIANKPVFSTVATSGAYTDLSGRPSLATVATSGAYNDLTGKPTLGTMAAQNASAVAITGGTIDGVTLNGGTF